MSTTLRDKPTVLEHLARELLSTGWASIEMTGEADATARRKLQDAASMARVKVHTFKGGPYKATMYAHITDPHGLSCCHPAVGICNLPVTPWVVAGKGTLAEWVRADLPKELRRLL